MKKLLPPPALCSAQAVAPKPPTWRSRAGLMFLLTLAAPVRAQKPVAVAPPVDYCQPTFSASQTTICQGGSAVLTFAESGCRPPEPVSYRWVPNRDISATTGPQVVVSPLVTTTYTLTRTPASGPATTASITVTVQADCCQLGTVPAGRVVELANYYGYNSSLPYGNDPFRTYPPGTYFHVAAGTLTLYNTEFHLPAGSVLLMEPGADVVLDDAKLYLDGSTITATCDEMWGGLLHSSHGHGLLAAPVGTLRPRLLHSRLGVQFTKSGTAQLALDRVDFLHNYQSLALDCSMVGAAAADFVKNCVFDADPALMKKPYRATATDSWYAQQHVSLLGDAGSLNFTSNTLRHALIGVNLLVGKAPVFNILGGQFAEVYLAGVFSGDYNPGSAASLSVSGTRFTFPVGLALPATSQVAQAQAQYGSLLPPKQTVGLSPLFVPLSVGGGTVFEQPDTGPYASFAYGKVRPRQVGIASLRLYRVLDSSFRGLTVGIAHFLRDGDKDTEVRGNVFAECEKGYAFQPVITPAPTAPTGTAYLSCNSFLRGVSAAQRSGVSYGIFNEDGANVTLADPRAPATQPAILKNLFDDAGAGAAGFYALYNANSSAGAALNYYTFANYSSQIAPLINRPQVNLTATAATPIYTGQRIDCASISPNGLQRATAIVAKPNVRAVRLEQNVPNPSTGTTRFAYEVPGSVRAAALCIYRASDGQLVTTIPLAPAGRYCDLTLRDYPAGSYFCSLVADGVPSATRRLVVQ